MFTRKCKVLIYSASSAGLCARLVGREWIILARNKIWGALGPHWLVLAYRLIKGTWENLRERVIEKSKEDFLEVGQFWRGRDSRKQKW